MGVCERDQVSASVHVCMQKGHSMGGCTWESDSCGQGCNTEWEQVNKRLEHLGEGKAGEQEGVAVPLHIPHAGERGRGLWMGEQQVHRY